MKALKTVKPDAVIQSRPWTFRPISEFVLNHWNSKKAAVRRCFSKQIVLKIPQYIQENTCVGAFRPATFFKKDSNTGAPCGYYEIFKNRFFYRTPPVTASGSPTTAEGQLGCLFFDFALPRAFGFDQKITQNVAQIILYYHVTKQFLSWLNWLTTCFWFQNMFWKNIS